MMMFTSLWCGMYGPARHFPQVGNAVVSADTVSRPWRGIWMMKSETGEAFSGRRSPQMHLHAHQAQHQPARYRRSLPRGDLLPGLEPLAG